MNYVGKLLSNFKGFYNEINSATLTGAIDIVIVQQEDGTYRTSPWHVRFGKLGVLRTREKVVDIEINGQTVDLHMKLGEAGEAFFVEEVDDATLIPDHLATSPLPDSLQLMEQGLLQLRGDLQQTEKLQQSVIPVDEALLVSESTQVKAPFVYSDSYDRWCSTQLDHHNSTILGINKETTSSSPIGELEEQVSQRIIIDNDQNKESESCAQQLSVSVVDPSSTHTSLIDDHGLPPQANPVIAASIVSTNSIIPSLGQIEVEKEQNASVSLTETNTNTTYPTFAASTTISCAQDGNFIKKSLIKPDTEDEISKKAIKDRRRRRRRKFPNTAMEANAATKAAGNNKKASPMRSVDQESCSSLELLDEVMFEMDDLSGDDEVDRALCLSSMGRTVSMPLIKHKMERTDEWASSQYAAALHPFSDGDITPVVSPVGSRPQTPKSDTEYENIMKYDATSQTPLPTNDLAADSVRWRWGELPENDGILNQDMNINQIKDEKQSGGLFQFMRKTKKIRHQPQQEGIYLDDINFSEMDPEVTALYIYQGKGRCLQSRPDEDSESGRGQSLPHSPLTVDDTTAQLQNQRPDFGASDNMADVSISLCGGLSEYEGRISHDKFLQSLVTYDEFCENPNIISNPNLVIKMGDKYYNWQVAGPIIMAVVAFQRPLPEFSVNTLLEQHMPKKVTSHRRGWMWWGRSTGADKKDDVMSPTSSDQSSGPNSPCKFKTERKRFPKSDSSDDESDTSMKSDSPHKVTQSVFISSSATMVTTGCISVETQISSFKKEFCKTLKPTSDQLSHLPLRPGVNEISFSVTSKYQGTSRCTASIYLWKWDDRIIISDIDGTITKSDVLGQVLPMIGKDWSQAGIANLYNKMERNGYKFIFLSARAIGQSRTTRDYLKSIRQGELGLPDGPLFLSPSSLISAFHKEVIERRPQDFKISCLRDMKALFPSTRNPFYAGFGNKINDVWAYQAVNIPISRIFTVNHKGELKHEQTCTFLSSYTRMSDTVDHLFPPLLEQCRDEGKIQSGNFPLPEQFSDFTYWRDPLPDIEIEIHSMLTEIKPDIK